MSVFARPENALSHLITTLVTTIIKPRMDSVIKPDLTAEVYLTNLYTEYQTMDKLIKELSDRLTLITDPSQLSKLFRDLFADYLSGYMGRERECLVRHLSKHLSQFYESRGHQKRLLNTSGLADLKRDLQAKLRIQPGERAMTDYEGSLLSEEVAINIIEDVRRAAKRCLLLSQPSEFGVNGKALFDYLHRFLIVDHIDYGVTVALHGLQLTDTRHSPPNLVFFSIVREATSIFHFFSKTVDESLAALINASPMHSKEINVRRQSIQQELESKLQLGLDRCLGLIMSHVQYVLASEQRKSDFRPDSVASGGTTGPAVTLGGPPSQACQRVVPFISQSIREAKQQLDGKNLKNFLAEFGLRFNRVLVEHYYGFTFSDTGGFLAMQDVTAYREVAKQFGNPAVDRLFDVLLKLMNLMLIKPENVQQVTQDYLQSGIPRELLNNFIQLRADYKVAKSQMEVRGKNAR
ncbi:Exocyst complex component 5 [Paragonimus heterotremus]|uniref:Exocyst complex component 5 n=1 Tax=Paragonimus heterotremus TaxID=100268 RepID=A0A8J4SX79_9TREM|nr:Exocyst complex component 5 [Paragonimus heterotremus]